MKKNLFIPLVVLSCWLGRTPFLNAQVANSYYNAFTKKTVYLDSLRYPEVEELAANNHFWDEFKTSTLIYEYMISKNWLSLDTNDTAHIGSWGHYMNLAHLRIIEHRYADAMICMVLAQKAEQPQFFCGNAYMEIYAEQEAFNLECALGLAPLSQKDALLVDLIQAALAPDEYTSYAGKGVLNYLGQFYSLEKLKSIFKKAASTIQVLGKKESEIHARVNVFNLTVPFSAWCYECEMTPKEAVVNHYLNRVDGWFPYEEAEE